MLTQNFCVKVNGNCTTRQIQQNLVNNISIPVTAIKCCVKMVERATLH